jgi:hypothetical protein
MIFCWRSLIKTSIGFSEAINQTRGMYGLRREGEITKKVESKAAATGANIALIDGLFKLCGFIFYDCYL